MGKKRIAFVDKEGEIITTKKQKTKEHQKVRVAGLKGGERVVDMGTTVEPTPAAPLKPKPATPTPSPSKASRPSARPKPPRVRGKAYQAARTKVDPNKTYAVTEAVKLVKEVSISKFDGAVETHISTHKKGLTGEVKLPYFKGKTKKVVVADDKVLEKIKAGKIDFDILLATKEFMPKLVPYAKLLGPKGLMPNPKTGTIVDDPKKALEKFSGGLVRFKTEKDAPLIHLVIGKVSQPEKELVENLQALITAVGPTNIKKLTLSPTMGPGIKIAFS